MNRSTGICRIYRHRYPAKKSQDFEDQLFELKINRDFQDIQDNRTLDKRTKSYP
jgi:hypothetical protein